MPRSAAQKAARRRRRLKKKGQLGPFLYNGPHPQSRNQSAGKKKRRNRNRKKKSMSVSGVGSARSRGLGDDYIRTLNDPFAFPGVRMGFGCLIPTQLVMAYVKGTFTVNAVDGSFRVNCIPWNTITGANNGALVNIANNGQAVAPVYTTVLSSNVGGINSQMSLGRIVSGGLRVSVKYPLTSAPGQMNAFSLAASSNTATTTTIQGDLGLTQAKLVGSDQAQILYRPTDYNDMEFINLNGSNAVSLGSWQGYIDGLGFPATSVVWYEACFHIEGYSTILSSISDIGQASGFPTLSEAYASVENLVSNVRTHLSPEVMELGVNFLTAGATTVGVNEARRLRLR
jgi:hypothetical protein